MFCEVRAVHKFAFRLVINEAPNGNQWKGHAVTQTDVFETGSICFPPIVVVRVKVGTHL